MKKTRLINARINMFIIFSFIFFCFGVGLFIQAENYPVVWRYSMFLNAPNSLIIPSLTLAILVVVLFFWRLSKHTKYFVYQYSQTILINGGIFVFSFVFLLSQLGLIFNGAFDNSVPVTHSTVVLDKVVKRNWRYGDRYYIYFRDWTDFYTTVQFPVNESVYTLVEMGDKVYVETKKGYFGYEWIVNHLQIRNGEALSSRPTRRARGRLDSHRQTGLFHGFRFCPFRRRVSSLQPPVTRAVSPLMEIEFMEIHQGKKSG